VSEEEEIMVLHIPRANQGQIVEVSYGWHEGDLYRRALDRSDRSVVIRVLRSPWDHVDEGSAEADELETWHPGGSGECPDWLDALIDEHGVVIDRLPEDDE
jgi:hypothetical protein